jgi:hypothetical protein
LWFLKGKSIFTDLVSMPRYSTAHINNVTLK